MATKKIKPEEKKFSAHPGKVGRPKLLLEQCAKEFLSAMDPDDDQKRPRIMRLLQVAYDSAVELGSIRAIHELLDRALGKPAQAMTLDANVTHRSTEEHVESILESVTVLGDDAEPSNQRVN